MTRYMKVDLDKLKNTALKHCPCNIDKENRDNICPCKQLLEEGKCHCMVFEEM